VNQSSQDYYAGKSARYGHGIMLKWSKYEGGAAQSEILDGAAIERGQLAYEKKCLSCHGQEARGQGAKTDQFRKKPADLILLAKESESFQFVLEFSKARAKMPGWAQEITRQELRDIETYIHSLRQRD
jgi:mono/diheme cytochrome c family protein